MIKNRYKSLINKAKNSKLIGSIQSILPQSSVNKEKDRPQPNEAVLRRELIWNLKDNHNDFK